MSSKRKFTGISFALKSQCDVCEYRKKCEEGNNSLTVKMIILECESFYYLFKQLEEFEKLPFLVLSENKETIDDYKKRHEGMPSLTLPFVENGAFAAELALKFLIFKEKGSFDCTHNLQCLFEQLPDCHKNVLIEMICEQAHQNKETLKLNLANISNLFEDFRYAFGKEHLGYTNFFNEFVHIVCEYAISKKPADIEEIEEKEEIEEYR